jgi:sterol desaturase/sphingolipid hydroxylase (fatty acid hydroxylase superfamily)
MQLPDYFSPLGIFFLLVFFFIVITGRYFLVAGIFYGVFYLWYPQKWKNRKINSRLYHKKQLLKEVKWSLVSSFIFAIAGCITIILWQGGFTKVYEGLFDYGLLYLPLSLIIFMFLHETYYYWLHRWMHVPSVFKIVHKIHHNSNITSPFTAFSFHPIEAAFQAIFLPMMLMILPMHYYVILLQLTIMTVSSVVNHLDIEIYPEHFHKHPVGRWLIGASHHSLHHKQFKYNYGLYFTFWDKLKNTESPFFSKLFEAKTSYESKEIKS